MNKNSRIAIAALSTTTIIATVYALVLRKEVNEWDKVAPIIRDVFEQFDQMMTDDMFKEIVSEY